MRIHARGRGLKSRVASFLCSFFLLLPATAEGQEEVVPLLRGEVREWDEPLPGVLVVLHQVSSEVSGEVDSVRADVDGAFTIRLPRVPDHGVRSEVYFASVRHRGLLYFGPAITSPAQLDSLYVIQAYDTVSVPEGGAEIPVAVRNLFLTRRNGDWEVTDFLQLRQGGDRTLFSPTEGVIWRYPLPPGARDFQVGQEDLGPDAIRFEGGGLAVYSPLPPGERYFLVRYRIPGDELTIPLPGRTDRAEVLVRNPGPDAEFPPLNPTTPVEIEPGVVFRRYAGNDLVNAEVRGRVLPDAFRFRAEWLSLILAAVLGAMGVYGYRVRRSTEREGQGPSRTPRREALLLEIARLDEAYGEGGDREAEVRSRYLERREDLLRQLKGLS
jgi:hypothetical protein